jgi:multidrug efflux system outer membrane protein
MPHRQRTLIVGCLLFALTGCAVGPDYQRPDTLLPQQFGETGGPQNDATAKDRIVRNDWWTLFNDSALNALIEQAMLRNTDVLQAVARIEEAEAYVREAGAAQFPEIDGNLGSSRTQTSTATATPAPAGSPRLRNLHGANLSTNFELDVWGRLRRASEAARAQALASHYAHDTVKLSLAGLVASNYLALRAYDAQLAVTREVLASREASLKLVQSRLAGGLVSPVDLQQAIGAVAAARAQLAGLRQQRALAEHQLGLLTGTPGLTVAAGDIRQIPAPPVPPPGLPSTLLQARPDIRQAEETLASANAQIGVIKATLYPTISLTGTLGSESKDLADLFTSAASTWTIGLGLVMPVLDEGRRSARVDQATARQRQAIAAYQKTVQTAFKEVNDALVSLRESAEKEQAQATQADAAKQVLRIAEYRYEAGYSGYLEVLDAQRSANDAQLNYLASRQLRLSSTVDLFKALGGGWQDPTPRVATATEPVSAKN